MPTSSESKPPLCLDKLIESRLCWQSGFLDNLPQFSWQILRDFLEPARKVNIQADDDTFKTDLCRILYHSIVDDPSQNQDNRDQHGRRKSATTADRRVFLDYEFFKNSKAFDAKRITYYVTDMSPLCAASLLVKENQDFVNVFRAYLQCYLAGQIQFKALPSKAHHVCPTNEWPRHIAVDRKFTYEFHLPYVVLRDRRETEPDERGLRQWTPLIEPLDLANDRYASSLKRMACYDAQVSLIVVGRHERNWTAYCNVDTYYGGQPKVEYFIDEELDAPAGDARSATQDVCTHPREYFLLVLSHRMRQISHEWSNVATAVCQRLADYEGHYLRTIDDITQDMHDDSGMTRTRSYAKAASMLRQFHDTISTTLDRFDEFIKENDWLYKKQDDFQDNCPCYKERITEQVTDLTRIRGRFFQRMERFESMRDSLLAASQLRENRVATKQSKDIELLTEMTVLVIPFSLAATILGMSDKVPPKLISSLWILISVGMLVATLSIYPLFRAKLVTLTQRVSGYRRLPRIARRRNSVTSLYSD